jgi:hypothetical protein
LKWPDGAPKQRSAWLAAAGVYDPPAADVKVDREKAPHMLAQHCWDVSGVLWTEGDC